MFKFLRKYNKWILAVGGTLLMIVFLVPQAIQTLSQRAAVGGAVWATVGEDDEEVAGPIRDDAARPSSRCSSASAARRSRFAVTNEPEHWYLLVREAEQAGLLGGRAADQLQPEVLGSLASIVGRSPALESSISKSMAVGRMIDLYQRAASSRTAVSAGRPSGSFIPSTDARSS